ncbi:MAG TPA: beta-ketoacyl synthase N-terminal-like domain-containing protein [Cellvibrio sp.]|nr:beta-ketoacyl synthase N-terminal-like domain-containing protein [Cellvibrio sp.]
MEKTSYIAGLGLISATGGNAKSVFAAYRAGINSYATANYFTHDHHLLTLSLVPNGALPPLLDELEEAEVLSFRDERILRMSQVAIAEALGSYQGTTVPLIFSGPENYAGINNQLNPHFLRYLQHQTAQTFDTKLSRILAMGRTGTLEALKLAQYYLSSGACEFVLIGGADSCQHSEWLNLLDRQGRIKSERPESKGDSFVPGEGAGFILLTANPDQALHNGQYRFALTTPALAREPGHLYSEEPYLGNGLDQAFKSALSALPQGQLISHIYSSINGESFWVKEMGVALTRSSGRFAAAFKHQHPADSYGDLGAASAAFLIALSCRENARASAPSPHLLYASSDHAFRAAVCLLPERISA